MPFEIPGWIFQIFEIDPFAQQLLPIRIELSTDHARWDPSGGARRQTPSAAGVNTVIPVPGETRHPLSLIGRNP